MRVEYERILFIGPHPDDVELGCGGLIARLADSAQIHYLILSPCLEDPRNANILDEAAAASRLLGIPSDSVVVENLARRTFHDNREAIRHILIRERDRIQPDLVFCPSTRDVHQDHQVTAEESVRLFRDMSVVAYESPRSSMGFDPTLYMKLNADHIERKISALLEYGSQFDRYYFDPDVIRSFARMRGAQCRSPFAEAFEVMRMTL